MTSGEIRPTWQSGIAVLAVASLAMLLAAEVVLHVVVVQPEIPDVSWATDGQPKYRLTGDVRRPYGLTPGLRWTGIHAGTPGRELTFTVNSLGLRGPETAVDKPEGVLRVLFVGDSVTEGSDVSDEDIFPRVVERLLNDEIHAPGRFETLNMGVGGYNTYTEKHGLFSVGFALDPDVVVVGFCYNDVRDIYRGVSDRDVLTMGRELPREAFPADSDQVVAHQRLQRLRNAPGEVQTETDVGRLDGFLPAGLVSFLRSHSAIYDLASHWTYFGRPPRFIWNPTGSAHASLLSRRDSPQSLWIERQFRDIVDSCSERSIPVVAALIPIRRQMEYLGYDGAQASLVDIAESAGADAVDLLPSLRSRSDAADDLYLDALHLSEAGHQIVADTLATVIRRLVATPPKAGL